MKLLWRVLWVLAPLVVMTLAVSQRPASAHEELSTTEPRADSVLDVSPTEIVLRFTGPIDPTQDAIRLLRADGTTVDLGPVTQNRGADSLGAAVPSALEDGSYVVAWSAVSADSHPIEGAFVFSVGAPSQGAGTILDDLRDDAGTTSGSEMSLTVGRFASYFGIAAFAGTLAAAMVLAPASLGGRRLVGVLLASGYLAMAGTIVMICAQASVVGSSFLDWLAVMNTQSGWWWLVRLAIIAPLTALSPASRFLVRRGPKIAAGLAMVGLLAAVTTGGHSASGRWLGGAFVATVVHLAATSFWLGGLLVIIFVVDRSSWFTAATRFSPLALAAVVAMVATGTFNGWRQLRGLGGFVESGYGRWLSAKLVIVAVVVGAAALSRRQVRGGKLFGSGRPVSENTALLRRTLLVEVVGMIAILGATAGLAGATPPRPPAGPSAVYVSVESNGQVALIEVNPAVTRGTTLNVTIGTSGGDLQPVEEITVSAELSDPPVGPIDIETVTAGPRRVTTDNANFPLPGRWTVIVTARYGEFDQVVFVGEVPISE